MDDGTREWLREIFDGMVHEHVPADVVPGTGPTRADLLAMNDAVDTTAEVTRPGEILLDVHGNIHAVGPPTVETVSRGTAGVTLAQLAAVGLEPDDVPRLHVIDQPRGTEDG